MEVHLGNLPPALNDQSLKRELTPCLAALSIANWTCLKQRKKKWGTATFLDARDGDKFLRAHGETHTGQINKRNGKPHTQARLHIGGFNVFCRKSTHEPDVLMLRSLAKEVDDRREAKKAPEAHESQDIVFAAQDLFCGYYGYNTRKELSYSPEIQWRMSNGIAKFGSNQLTVTWESPQGKLKMEIAYRTVVNLLTCSRAPSLTLTLWEPPRIYNIAGNDGNAQFILDFQRIQISEPDGPELRGRKPTKTRLTEIPHHTQSHSDIIGQCLIYRISVHPQEFVRKVERLRARDVLSISAYSFPPTPLYNPSFVDGLRHFQNTMTNLAGKMPFEVLYQLNGLVRNGYLLPWTVQSLLNSLHARLAGGLESLKISGMAIKKLFAQISFPAPDVDASTFDADSILKWLEEAESEIRRGHINDLISDKARNNLAIVYKVQVTPTTFTLQGPEAEAKNRILRRFEQHHDYFVRVQFCDEDGQDVRFTSKTSNDDVYQRFLRILNQGIQIGGRKYDFLGFSHSSLRNHSVWFMAPFYYEEKLQTYFSVIDYLGKFAEIYSPARCAARIGQAFSETPFAISLKDHGIKSFVIGDLWSRDNQNQERNFSDGVGRISPEAVDEIRESLPQNIQATCFQIRWAGAKGMLAQDSTLTGRCMLVRKSMIKFNSDANDNLEICDMANKPIPLFLNRQMIKILEDMAVPHEWFLAQQSREVQRLKSITKTTFNTAAFLKRQKIADHVGLPMLLRRLDQMQIDYKRDTFLCSVVEAVVLRELRLLKHKARIPINNGVTLFGIVDETRTLEEGEVFITFDKTRTIRTDYRSLGGCDMIVTRSPALHPGDIQLAMNRVPPLGHPLRNLRNCIVFSQKGKRDLPSQLSGGDLDGDIYNIIWDPEAVDGVDRIFPAAEYPLVMPKTINRQVTKEDMTKFFVEFMKTDNLGMIAVRHMILADQMDAGTVHADCKLLAQLHSTGVDYSKTGVPIDLSLLRTIKNNRYRPDFLAPAPPAQLLNRTDISFDESYILQEEEEEDDDNSAPRFRYYQSEKILGHLFRAVDEKKIWNEHVRINRKTSDGLGIWGDFLNHVSKQCQGRLGGLNWEQRQEEAWLIRDNYDDEIIGACTDYSEHAMQKITELEVFIGEIFNKSGSQTRRQKDRSIKLKDEYSRIARWAESKIRRRPMSSRAAEQGEDDEYDDFGETATASSVTSVSTSAASLDALELGIACLFVACVPRGQYGNPERAGRHSSNENQSFKVVSACCIVKELDKALSIADIRAGAAYLGSGGFVGTSTGRRR